LSSSTSFLVNIGGGSWLHRLDPRVKLLLLCVYTICPLFFAEPLYISIFILLSLPLWITSKIKWKPMIAPFTGMAVLVFFVVLFNLVWGGGRTADTSSVIYKGYRVLFSIGPFQISNLSFKRAIFLGLRLVVPLTTGLLIVSTTDPSILAKGMRKLGVPTVICYLLLISLRFIPIIFDQMHNILDAMTIRGVAGKGIGFVFRRFKLALMPLFLTSLRRTRVTGIASECRGFGSGKWKTYYEEFSLDKMDMLIIVYSVIIICATIYIRFILGLGWSDIGNF
jgi:energy-coupling factor transport system permease protein